ncbi:hypothetical protein [Cellulosilyticum sp. I15G10I2]|uniref:hypothetical protein n=1 Tax=Cellulosilyticum sp. I15G10I2 TaxID=1892843 RepID=UPI00085C0E28|nr:hypothetical protein [Cellulosilyticum sp. I15G10I2]
MINRYELVSRHNPILKEVDLFSPLTVGNGDFAYTVDVTGMQTLYTEHKASSVPLCTMSSWGWHTAQVSEKQDAYTMDDLEMTEYNYAGRKVTYAVEMKAGNEEVYKWLRHNPHRINLGQIGLIFNEEPIRLEDLSEIHQELKLYEGIIESRFKLHGIPCKVTTACDYHQDVLGIHIESEALAKGQLSVRIAFPYGATDITASDWESPNKHRSTLCHRSQTQLTLKRKMHHTVYYVDFKCNGPAVFTQTEEHMFKISASSSNELNFTTMFSKEYPGESTKIEEIFKSSQEGWRSFWEDGAAIDLHKSKDPRAMELERRIVLSQYLMAIQSCGSMPPQETGLTCNSWYGKFHLEMHLWHSANLPLWNRTRLLKRSLQWYKEQLEGAKMNAARNGYKGARWPKMVAYNGIDSPSLIATLLIWQQPHIIYMLELAYQSGEGEAFLKEYWEIVKETAEFMVDFTVYNDETRRYDLRSPIIPAQEEHDPTITINPTFEVEYWRFTLKIAFDWAKRLGYEAYKWNHIADNMAELPIKDGFYLAHENCPATFEKFNKDHPSMVGAFGLIQSDRVSHNVMKNTLEKVFECWDFSTMWGWDFAMMAMTAVRLGDPETAIDILLKDTPKNSYVASGNNFQKLRRDLPLYLPGNGSLLLAIPLMTAGYTGCTEKLPGFPKNGMWKVEFENMNAYPY